MTQRSQQFGLRLENEARITPNVELMYSTEIPDLYPSIWATVSELADTMIYSKAPIYAHIYSRIKR